MRSRETALAFSPTNVTAFGESYSTMRYVIGVLRPRNLATRRNSVPLPTTPAPTRAASTTPGSHSALVEKSLRYANACSGVHEVSMLARYRATVYSSNGWLNSGPHTRPTDGACPPRFPESRAGDGWDGVGGRARTLPSCPRARRRNRARRSCRRPDPGCAGAVASHGRSGEG